MIAAFWRLPRGYFTLLATECSGSIPTLLGIPGAREPRRSNLLADGGVARPPMSLRVKDQHWLSQRERAFVC
jgi:hypothetical protein